MGAEVPFMAVDENPVADEVNEVGGDERECDGFGEMRGLQVTAKGEVDEQRDDAPVETVERGDGLREDGSVDGHAVEDDGAEGEDGDEERAEGEGEDESVEEPAVGGVDFFGAEGLGDEGVEAEEDAADAEGEGVEDDLGEGGGGHGDGGVREAADHAGVDDRHGHPAELAGDEGRGEPEERGELRADVGKAHSDRVSEARIDDATPVVRIKSFVKDSVRSPCRPLHRHR